MWSGTCAIRKRTTRRDGLDVMSRDTLTSISFTAGLYRVGYRCYVPLCLRFLSIYIHRRVCDYSSVVYTICRLYHIIRKDFSYDDIRIMSVKVV